jgi:cell division protein YceG involved in septum cleavage
LKKSVLYVFLFIIGVVLIVYSVRNITLGKKNHELNAFVEKTNKLQTLEIDKEEILKNSLKEEKPSHENKTDEIVTITIKDDYTSDTIADLLYQKGLISHKEDFKILLNLKTVDPLKAGQALTEKGVISKGWKIEQLLKIIAKNYDPMLNILYHYQLIDNKESADFFMRIFKENRKIIPGEKEIRKGSSIHEIIEIITK